MTGKKKIKTSLLWILRKKKETSARTIFGKICFAARTIDRCLHERDRAGLIDKPVN